MVEVELDSSGAWKVLFRLSEFRLMSNDFTSTMAP